ncbi:hypothetical protein ABIF05_002178 [Bradyrhizobium elkanii]
MLVGQLVELAVRRRGERLADEVVDVEHRVGDVLALTLHVVRQDDGLAVAEVGADQVGVVDPAVIDVLARLHLGLQLLDDVTFLDDVVLELDAGQFGERLGQRLRFIFVRRDRFRDDVDLHALEGFGGLGEPLELLLLVFLRQRRGLEFRDPLLDHGIVGGAGRRGDRERGCDQRGGAGHSQKTILCRSQMSHYDSSGCSDKQNPGPGRPRICSSSLSSDGAKDRHG